MRYKVPKIESSNDEEQILAHALELFRSHGKNHATTQAFWPKARAVATRFAGTVVKDTIPGSWNHPIAGAVLLALMEDSHWSHIEKYCTKQLDGSHRGFWGSEAQSHIYPQPITSLAVAFEVKPIPKVRQVLRAHAYLLALQTLPKPYMGEPGEPANERESAFKEHSLPFQVCCGGMRSQWPYRGNVYLTYALAAMLSPVAPNLPTWRKTNTRIQGWPFRVMKHTTSGYLTQVDRQVLSGHIESPNPRALVAELQALGVTSRARLEIARYANGQGYSFFATNTHSSTPPLMGQSQVGGKYRTLGLHPEHLRGHGGNRLGTTTAKLEGGRIVGTAAGIVVGDDRGKWPPLDSPITTNGTVTASIPIPDGEPLFKVIVDRQGVRLVDGPPPPPPPNTSIKEALALIDQAIPGIALERQARTAAEVLRRILRGDRLGGGRGAGTLVRLLQAATVTAALPVDDPRIKRALVIIDKAARGAALERQARTAAEVLRRTIRDNRDGALSGASTLVRLLS